MNRASSLLKDPEILRLIRGIEKQGKMGLLIHNLNLITKAAKNGMDMEKYEALLKQPGVYLGEPGKTEELIARCMPGAPERGPGRGMYLQAR
jgi:hypothetical protein